MLVDDSPLALDVLADMLGKAPEIRVVGTALDGRAGLDLVRQLRPDVLLTDLHMPGLGGLQLTRQVMSDAPTPIIVVSASTTEEDVFRLLAAGAVDVYLKPDEVEGPAYERKARELVAKVRVAAGVSVFRRRAPPPVPVPRSEPLPPVPPACVVAIGSSTGGPQALRAVLGALPRDFPVPVLCVQHIAEGFLQGLVDWLAAFCALEVKVAAHGEKARAGTVYFAPEHRHLVLRDDMTLAHVAGTPVDGHVPSATTTFRSVSRSCGTHGIGVLLTGMGRDGAEGLLEMRRSGAITIAQDAATSLVHGMPGAAIARGAATHVLSLQEIARRLAELRLSKQ